jgi:hypothetical protein
MARRKSRSPTSVAAFDREREQRHVPSISVALVEDGRVSLFARDALAERYRWPVRAPWPE